MRVLRKKDRAFTLVELLVVISIIALLMAIMMPSLSKAKELAKRAACSNNLHQMAIGWTTYDVDFGQLPPGSWGKANMVGNDQAGCQGAHRYLAKSYGISAKAVQCPSAWKTYTMEQTSTGDWETRLQVWDGGAPWGLMTYNYLGGYGGATPTNVGVNESGLNAGWIVTNGKFWAYKKYGIGPELAVIRCKKPSVNPLFLDIADWFAPAKIQRYGNNKPMWSSHSRGVSRLGQNVMFYDMHQEWQYLEAGVSWRFGADWRQNMWLTDPGVPDRPPVRSYIADKKTEGWKP